MQVVAVPRGIHGRVVFVTSLRMGSDSTIVGWAATPGASTHAERHARELGERLTVMAGGEQSVAANAQGGGNTQMLCGHSRYPLPRPKLNDLRIGYNDGHSGDVRLWSKVARWSAPTALEWEAEAALAALVLPTSIPRPSPPCGLVARLFADAVLVDIDILRPLTNFYVVEGRARSTRPSVPLYLRDDTGRVERGFPVGGTLLTSSDRALWYFAAPLPQLPIQVGLSASESEAPTWVSADSRELSTMCAI